MRQHFIDAKYKVVFDDYAERHFIKDFEKKHKKHWHATRESLASTLERIANLSGTSPLNLICASNKETNLLKFEFKIAKSEVSPKTSGNRCILEVCNRTLCVTVLFIYCKEHIDEPSETVWWKKHIGSAHGLCCV